MNRRLKSINWFLSGGTQVDPGLSYLLQNARAYYDFTALSGNSGDVVPATFADLSPNNRDLTRINSPTINTISVDGNTFKGLNTNGTAAAYRMSGNGIGVFNSSFEFWMVFGLVDAQISTVQRLAGIFYPTGAGTNAFQIFVQDLTTAAGKIQFTYKATNTYNWRTNSFTMGDGPSGQQILRCRLDFETDTVLVEMNGTSSTLTNVTGTGIAGIDPTTWNASSQGCAIGNLNDNGTYSNNASDQTICRVAITPLLTDLQAAQVFSYLNLGD